MSEHGLPSTTPRYEFKGIEDSLEILDQEQDQYERNMELSNPYIVFIMDERSFLDNMDVEQNLLAQSCESYDPSINHALIRLETQNHAIAAAALEREFHDWVYTCDNNDSLIPTGTATYRSGMGKYKRGDRSWRLFSQVGGRSTKWPALVVEVAWSEPRTKLANDVKFWLTQSNGEVKVALTLTVQPRGRIILEKWKVIGADQTLTSCQKIEIVRKPAPKCEKITGSLKVPFEDLYGRPKQPNETDFFMTTGAMERLAMFVWTIQFGDV